MRVIPMIKYFHLRPYLFYQVLCEGWSSRYENHNEIKRNLQVRMNGDAAEDVLSPPNK